MPTYFCRLKTLLSKDGFLSTHYKKKVTRGRVRRLALEDSLEGSEQDLKVRDIKKSPTLTHKGFNVSVISVVINPPWLIM